MDELFLLRTHLARLVVERGRDASTVDGDTYLALGEREMQLLMTARARRTVRGRVGGGTTSGG